MWLFFIDIPRQVCRKVPGSYSKIFMLEELERQMLLVRPFHGIVPTFTPGAEAKVTSGPLHRFFAVTGLIR
jgi:hypothetical protein